MAAKVKKATESLSCPVCLQIFKNPKYLPCYHSYCEECLAKLHTQSEIKCPECREVAKIPEGGVKSLPNNFLVNRLVDDLILKSKVEDEDEVQCDDCSTDDPAASYCPICNTFLCHACTELHKRDRNSVSHIQDVIPFTKLKSSKDLPIYAKPKALMCEKHSIELLFYCETCEELVCLYCTTKEHSGHVHDAVKQLAGKHRDELKTVTTPIKETINSLSNGCKNLDKMVAEIKKCGSKVEKDIDQHYNEMIQKLVEQKEQMKQQLQHEVLQKTKAIGAQMEELNCMQAEMLSIAEKRDAIEKGSDQEMLSAKKEVINRMLKAMNKYNKMDIQPLHSATMEFMPTKEPLLQVGQLFTHIDPSAAEVTNLPQYAFANETVEFSITTKYYSGNYCSNGGSQVVVQLQYDANDTTLVPVKDNNDGRYTASFTPKKVGKAKLVVLINGLKIREDPYTIMVRKTYLAVSKPSNIIDRSGRMGQPWGIAFSQNGMCAVTDLYKHCVYVFDKQDELVVKIGSRGNNIGRFQCPYGVAFDADNNLYVADGGNNRVQKFDAAGNYLLHFGSKGSSDGQLNNPHGITIHGDKLYVADCNNKRISIFQIDNGEFYHFDGMGHLDAPYDLSVNTSDHLLVVDHNQHCVCTFTLDGEFVSKFGSKGKHWGQLNEPCSLITDLNDCILVADSGNHRVLIFDKAGNCINCIGCNIGSAAGEFNCPCGIALSSNGSIYINDSANKRVQVFSTF